MRARAVMYAALFTAGVEALAIFSTQQPEGGRVMTAHTALAAPAPAIARAELPVSAPSMRVAQNAPKPANVAGAAMASATEKLNNARPLYDRMVRKRRVARQQHKRPTNYAWPKPSELFAARND